MEYITLDSDDEDIIVPPSPSQSNVTVPINDTGAGLRSISNFIPGGVMRGARGAMRGAEGAMRGAGGAMRGARGAMRGAGGAMTPSQSSVTVPVNDTGAGLQSRSNVVLGGAGGYISHLAKSGGARGAKRGAGGAMAPSQSNVTVPVNDTGAGLQSSTNVTLGGPMAPSQSNVTVTNNDTLPLAELRRRSNVIPGGVMRDLAESGGVTAPSQSKVTVPVNDTGAGLQNRSNVIPGGAIRDVAKSGGAVAPSQSNVTVPNNDTLPLAELRRRSQVVAGGAMSPPDVARSVKVNHISTRPRILSPPKNTGTPGVSGLPTALGKTYLMRKRARK